jgi:hypothetical protein
MYYCPQNHLALRTKLKVRARSSEEVTPGRPFTGILCQSRPLSRISLNLFTKDITNADYSVRDIRVLCLLYGTDKFYLSLLGSLDMMHVIDAVLDSFSNLFRSCKHSPLEKLFSVVLFAASLSLRDLSERLSLTGASRESVRIWVHRFSSIFRPSRRKRRLVAVDEAVLKVTRSDLLPLGRN